MFVQMICKDRNEKEMNELYEVLGLIARREEVQIEDRYDHVDILVCPQGKIVVTEKDGDMVYVPIHVMQIMDFMRLW